jgi:PelA/Pel-15E family pectate lyase
VKAILWTVVFVFAIAQASGAELRERALTALQRGADFFRNQVAVEGTYLWQYSDDLTLREGEVKASATQAWVQPPGTPAVGMAFLAAWQATSNTWFLEAARETAHGLVRGQLLSGGWTYSIDFSKRGRTKAAYRDGGKKTARNTTTFDDDTTQAALRFLMRTDAALGLRDKKIRDSIEYALNAVLKAQYPNGAWPQGYDQFPQPEKFPVKRASYPDTWSRTWPGSQQYWFRYTLNDNAMATMIETMFEAAHTYSATNAGALFNQLATRCRAAAVKAGDFLLLAQMPEPQPAWAQQYDFDMHPSWARKFEPPAVTGGESQGAIRALMLIYRESGNRKYLEPIPRALDYLRRSRLPNGQMARFYELRSNKPLYFTRDYVLTYDDSDMPTHYGFKTTDNLDAIAREYERVKGLSPAELNPSRAPERPTLTPKLIAEVEAIIAAQDARGRWIENGKLKTAPAATRVIRCATFNHNIETLSRYLAATKP